MYIGKMLDELNLLQNRKNRDKGKFYDFLAKNNLEINEEERRLIHYPSNKAVE